MIKGGYDGMHEWLKLDQEYIYEHHLEIRDFAEFNDLNYNDPYDLLWTLLGYSNAMSRPWQHPVIDPKAMNDLALDAQMGNEDSKELLVLYMYKTVAKVAGRFSWACDRFCLERTDLIHEGILGIYNALNRWSLDEKSDFPYWAEQWIYSAIQESVTERGPMVKLPHHIRVLQSKIPKIREELEEILGYQASYTDMAFYIRAEGYDVGINRMLSGPEIAMLEVHDVRSLNEIINEDESEYIEVMDLIPDDGSNMLDGNTDLLKELEYRDLVEVLMDRLDDVEQFVTQNYRSGLGTLKADEVAAELADKDMTAVIYTQGTISNIFDRACIKMRDALKELDLDKDMVFG